MTVLEYDLAVKRISQLMNKPLLQEVEKSELETILDAIDSFTSSDIEKVQSN